MRATVRTGRPEQMPIKELVDARVRDVDVDDIQDPTSGKQSRI
jgi:hypothetical protein